MKKVLLLLTCLASFSAMADMSIEIKASEDFKISSYGLYRSTVKSQQCTDLIFTGKLIRELKIQERHMSVKTADLFSQVDARENLKDRCKSELFTLIVKANHPKIVEAFRELTVVSSGVNLDDKVQRIVYKKVRTEHGLYYATQINSILVGPNGLARVEISIDK